MSIATFLATLTIIAPPLFKEPDNILMIIFQQSIAGIFFLYIVLVSVRAISRMGKFQSAEQRNLMNYLKWFSILSYGGVTFVYVMTDPIANTLGRNLFFEIWFIVLPQILIDLGYILFYFGYIRIDNPSVIQPQKIDQFIVISDDGLPIFNYKFESQTQPIDDALLSGAITAIKMVLSEATKFAGDLEEIRIGGDYLMLNRRGKFTGILFTIRPTSFLSQTLSNIVSEINTIMGGLNDFAAVSDEIKSKLDSLITNTLTYK
jgi:hypothetical protein